MNPLRSLSAKLVIAFVLVAIVAVGVVAWLANRTTAREFQLYVSQGKQQRAERLAPEFAAYYARSGGWAGADEWVTGLVQAQTTGEGQGQGRGFGRGRGLSDERLVLADSGGLVLADSQGDLPGQQLSAAEMASGTPITVGGQPVGFLLIPAGTSVHDSLEKQFLDQVNSTLLLAGLIAGVVALVLGLMLARQLTAPLRALTQAAQNLAQGVLDGTGEEDLPQVTIRSQDEIGQLTLAFNQMSRSLARQQTLRRNLMADVAHELRTPLSVVRGDLEALLDGVYEPTPEILISLHEETLLLSRLVDDLRDLALAEAGQLRLDQRPTDLVDLLRSVVSSYEPQAKAQGQILSLDLPSGLPLVDVDPQRIRQVVANLIANALRHTFEAQGKAGKGQVAVSATLGLDTVEISVTDNGPGIPPGDLPHVFDRFWQGDRARAGSSGLGLAIAQELVRAHGGHIWAECATGLGAKFSFVVPVHQGQD